MITLIILYLLCGHPNRAHLNKTDQSDYTWKQSHSYKTRLGQSAFKNSKLVLLKFFNENKYGRFFVFLWILWAACRMNTPIQKCSHHVLLELYLSARGRHLKFEAVWVAKYYILFEITYFSLYFLEAKVRTHSGETNVFLMDDVRYFW
jgi:hypothetical protein